LWTRGVEDGINTIVLRIFDTYLRV
jgi:hypothetical protein